MSITATFVRSAAGGTDLPRDSLPAVALVGRSNVGKSSLINALVRQRLARTSAAPGKTRLANIYRVARGASAPLYLVDLPGYGFAGVDRHELEQIAAAYFDHVRGIRLQPDFRRRAQSQRHAEALRRKPDATRPAAANATLLVVDARHPGLENDLAAWTWLQDTIAARAIVATKIDKLSRDERLRAIRAIQAVFETPVTAVSAVTGEGLDELWKLIDRLTKRSG